ncbi:MAG TPA: calcium/proton exchanger [Candidatus Poseidoniales archaeon]|nr:MAG: calcium/proton exchanger [Euryarchaeota archaeon]HHZ74268.1 calcium/proton exchanger [Candidatus Poseidoniales archaeon]PXY75783.1 MAG: calcium/proton exchanger [Euryarchaeota archaeon]PXY78323.1 MAG: calcium/proton exchanger [Euryarchaeota archaeon]PXY79480.1 MAG: calcium/proton exchanger [Euryarchaeota archaeon]
MTEAVDGNAVATELGWEGVIELIDPRQSKLSLMLVFIPLAIYFSIFSHNAPMAFATSIAAIMPLAYLMGEATEQIALKTNDSIGGLLNATFGNAAEMIIAIFAVMAAATAIKEGDAETAATMISVVQASLIGSILGNLLLVLGIAFVWGGIHHKVQEFSGTQVGANGSLLFLAVIALILPTAYGFTGNGHEEAIVTLSRITAVILLIMYGLFLLFQLRTHTELFATDGDHDEEPVMGRRQAMTLLIGATIMVAWMAEIMVHSIQSAADEWGLPTLFIGVILLPLFGNAAEHFTAVSVAGKNKMDLAFSIAVGSSTQIAVFVAPAMVMLAWIVNVPLTFQFGLFETLATFLAVLITNAIASDGKSNWLEGSMLLATYAILAVAFFLY